MRDEKSEEPGIHGRGRIRAGATLSSSSAEESSSSSAPIALSAHGSPRRRSRPKQGFGGFGMGGGATDLNAYLKIGEDGKVTVLLRQDRAGTGKHHRPRPNGRRRTRRLARFHHHDHGRHGLCPWDMGTFGSMSIRIYGPALRSAAAEAKAILLEMASEQLKTPKDATERRKRRNFRHSDKKNQVTFAQLTKGQKITRKLDQKPSSSAPPNSPSWANLPARRRPAKVTGQGAIRRRHPLPGHALCQAPPPPGPRRHAEKRRYVRSREDPRSPSSSTRKEWSPSCTRIPEAGRKGRARHQGGISTFRALTVDDKPYFDYLVKTAPKPQQSERRGDLAAGEKAAGHHLRATYLNGYGAHASIETHTAWPNWTAAR